MEQEVGGSSPPNCTTIVTCFRECMVLSGFPRLDANSFESPACHAGTLHSEFTNESCGGRVDEMSVSRSGNWRAVWVMGAMSSALIMPTVAWAYTAEQQQACTGDAFRLCSSEIPSIERITAHLSELCSDDVEGLLAS